MLTRPCTLYARRLAAVLIWILALTAWGCGGAAGVSPGGEDYSQQPHSASAAACGVTVDTIPELTPQPIPDVAALSVADPASLPHFHPTEQLLDMIRLAGISDYADYGYALLARGKIRIVSPPTLPDTYNAYAWITEEEIWLNTPMYERYPNIIDQATILLHEMVHTKNKVATHDGPWWHVLSEFRAFYNNAVSGVEVSGPFGGGNPEHISLPPT